MGQLSDGECVVGTSIAVFTRDLRVRDNPVLHAAAAAQRCIPLFVVDDAITGSSYMNANRASFLADSLADLDAGLRGRGGVLVVRRGSTVAEVVRVAREHDADEVHIASDVSRFAQRRERELARALGSCGAELHVHDSCVTAVPPLSISPVGGNDHFSVFTPYFRRWQTQVLRRPLRAPGTIAVPQLNAGEVPTARLLHPGPPSPDLCTGGEQQARKLLTRWVRDAVDDYADRHDTLADDGTSRLSAHLHFGTLSVTELLHRVGNRSEGARAFARQLAWRDFHHQVLAARPDSAHDDLRPRGDRWRRSEEDLDAWRAGRTGYPIVDAGMRQLAREGWMHNRARLITANFLAKTLYLDWRLGARHFTDLLVDCDIANNQMNWQWAAGTGTDTRPNRVLNPLAQARRFDPDGHYVREYVPELRHVTGRRVHQPWTLPRDERDKIDYPDPIVDLHDGASRFLVARTR
ncbi:deoxyribodipyrimidine photo-lyase [Actinokineospora spheciospongiae]|nr:deoxyribodipyrimidine photo-lyase [Actinokineospora spheciospongiae]